MRRSKNAGATASASCRARVAVRSACGGDDDDDEAAPAATEATTDAETGASEEGGSTLYMTPKNIGNPVFDLTNEGMKEAAAELGDTTEFNGSTEADAQQQVEAAPETPPSRRTPTPC